MRKFIAKSIVWSSLITVFASGFCVGFYLGRDIYRDKLINSIEANNRLLASYHEVKVLAIQMLIDKHESETGEDEE